MNQPTVSRLGDAYLYSWPAPDFAEIEIDQVRRERETWHSWITVRTRAPGISPHLTEGSLNLAAIQSRSALARTVGDRAPGVDWAGMLEMACILTVRAEREGAPFERAGSMPVETQSPWVLEPLVRRASPTIAFADGGQGKSTTALFVAALVSGNISACGFTTHISGPVAVLDWETDRADVDDTYKKIRRGLDVAVPDVFYRREVLPLHQTAPQIRRMIDQEGIVMVVLDSIGAAMGDDPENAAAVLRYFAAVRSLGVPSWNVDHVTKAGGQPKPFGSAYKHNSARLTFEQRLSQQPGDDVVHLGIYARKANKGRLLAPFGLAVTYTEDAIRFAREDISAPALVSGLSASQQIKLALQDARRSLNMTEIIDVTGLKDTVARARTNDLIKSGIVVSIPITGGANKYALATNREEE